MNSLILDLMVLIEAEREEKEARERYSATGGCEWGYHGHYYTESLRKATEKLESTLNQVIDARVRAVLEQMNQQEKQHADQ